MALALTVDVSLRTALALTLKLRFIDLGNEGQELGLEFGLVLNWL